MKYLVGIIIILIPIYFFTVPQNEIVSVVEKSDDKEEKNIIRLKTNNEIINIDLEEYIIGVIGCEMPASFEMEALKAQAVASRTYALEKINNNSSYDLENSINNQCYHNIDKLKQKWKSNFNKYYSKIVEAVSNTKGEYLTYNNKIIKAFFFSTSNGKTENVEDVFVQNLGYLRSVDSSWDQTTKNFKKSITLSEKEFLKKLNIDSNKIESIKVNSITSSGRINYITINNNKIRGTKLRNLLGLRSTDADIQLEDGVVTIITKGYGHGVGMSQYGANEMAKQNKTYKEILLHYYTDVELENI